MSYNPPDTSQGYVKALEDRIAELEQKLEREEERNSELLTSLAELRRYYGERNADRIAPG